MVGVAGSLHDVRCLPMQNISSEREGITARPSCLSPRSHAYTAIPVEQASSGHSTTYRSEMDS
ncbi:hypothetical protein Krac_5571 [Ktedonobacter racemifer DSM 44963]|uniref:Uncharacterized protein n=1 Tax=Ktedonobacter racemifer DSM 44963 TaxID=485913 RepID=D6TWC4_KTERA|nr:hypothetical protein Krac_5571 [Ktedonobacter racemifer DSM 44963]